VRAGCAEPLMDAHHHHHKKKRTNYLRARLARVKRNMYPLVKSFGLARTRTGAFAGPTLACGGVWRDGKDPPHCARRV